MRRMMKYVEEAGRDAGVWENNPRDWTTAKVNNLYEKTQCRFKVPPKKGTRRYEALLWKSYVNILKDNKGLVRPDETGDEAVAAAGGTEL